MNLKNIFLLILLTFSVCFLGFSQNSEYINNQIIVKFKSKHFVDPVGTKFNLHDLDILNSKHQIKSINELRQSTKNKDFLLTFKNNKDIKELVNEYLTTGLFEYVEPNYIVRATGILTAEPVEPNDPFYNQQWALKNRGNFTVGGIRAVEGADINIESAWEIEKGSTSILVAV